MTLVKTDWHTFYFFLLCMKHALKPITTHTFYILLIDLIASTYKEMDPRLIQQGGSDSSQ